MSVVLVVHHDADLYGADRSLLASLRAMKKAGIESVVAVPRNGPLLDCLHAEEIEFHIGPVVKLARQKLSLGGLIGLAGEVIRSFRFMSAIAQGRTVELVYTNSVAALGGAMWAYWHGIPRLWHVREIVTSPRIAAKGFPWLLRHLGGWCVCNSEATRRWIVDTQPALAKRSTVIWNGLEELPRISPEAAIQIRRDLGLDAGDLLVTLVGRINRWKGQGVLIEAARQLRSAGRHTQVRFLIVGDVADGQNHFREAMLRQITDAGLQDIVLWRPFTSDIRTVWAATDIAVVPSVGPESFGRVAIEAMAHGKPVIAADNGGLAEIVQDGQTGLLVRPGDAAQLAASIARLVDSQLLRERMGAAGGVRQQQLFTQDKHDRELLALLDKQIRARG